MPRSRRKTSHCPPRRRIVGYQPPLGPQRGAGVLPLAPLALLPVAKGLGKRVLNALGKRVGKRILKTAAQGAAGAAGKAVTGKILRKVLNTRRGRL